MTKIFADAYFFLALMNKRDRAHQEAVRLIDTIPGPIVTTQWILVEVADAFCHPRERPLFSGLLGLIEADRRIQVLPATNSSFQNGAEFFKHRPDKSWSLTDCISFAIMDQEHIRDVLSADHHFAQAGFNLLLAEQTGP